MAAATDIRALEEDPRLYLYTSLTAGSSHIITATSRIQVILTANKYPWIGVDLATNEAAKRLFQRRGGKRKLPVLVKEGFVLGVRPVRPLKYHHRLIGAICRTSMRLKSGTSLASWPITSASPCL